jgi:RNA recognition motif-containing protein
METKLYVGNLAYTTTENDLRRLFAQAGQVSQVDLRRDENGQSRGFAFVVMGSPAQAQKAIAKFNGFSLADRKLKVNAARPREGNDGNRNKLAPKNSYQSKLGGFTIVDPSAHSVTPQSRKSGYHSTLGAFGTKPPPPSRRRSRGQRG